MTEKQRVTITVCGPPASGKNAIAQHMRTVLRDCGFSEVENQDQDKPHSPRALSDALAACRDKTAVTILIAETRTPRRSPMDADAVERHLEQTPGGLPAVCESLRALGYKVEHDPGAALNAAVDAMADDADGGIVLLIMPRDLGKHPDGPRGHAAMFSRADVVAEWRDGSFHICKRKV